MAGAAKRAADLVLSALALAALLPVLGAVAAAVRLGDGGPAMYRQRRVGLRGRVFTIFKFRTMHVGAERGIGPIWSVPADPRCTRLGAFLRRSGIDELPQLWNVLRGDMSLVGPRPERPEFVRRFRKEYPGYDLRHRVRPGLTGYAQVHGWRGSTDLGERLRHDLHYLEHWSAGLDLYVLALTLMRAWSEKTRAGVSG